MSQKSQISRAVADRPGCALHRALRAWKPARSSGARRIGLTGKALRDGLDFWGGGFLALHGHLATLFDVRAYQAFFAGLYGKLPYHLWSYPPNYLLIALPFGWLPPWPAVLSFDLLSLLLLAVLLRVAGKSGWFIAAVLASPASLENMLEHQNAALLTALIGGGLLLLPRRPRLGGVLIGLATIKPQLGLALPLFLLRRAPAAFGCGRRFRAGFRRALLARPWAGGVVRLLAFHPPGNVQRAAHRPAAGLRGRADQRLREFSVSRRSCGAAGSGGGQRHRHPALLAGALAHRRAAADRAGLPVSA